MRAWAKKIVGLVVGTGFLLQIACSSFAIFSGSCLLLFTNSTEISLDASELPPCHQAQESSAESQDCCGKEKSISSGDSGSSFDWEKKNVKRVVLYRLLSIADSFFINFEKVSFHIHHPYSDVSLQGRLALLQVFLI